MISELKKFIVEHNEGLLTIAVFLVLVAVGSFIYFSSSVHIWTSAKAEIYYHNNGIDIEEYVTDEESKIIHDIFAGKGLHFDDPSCGFRKETSIRIGNSIFEPACDSCGIVKYGFKYFTLDDEENRTLRDILNKHGAIFPCV